MIISLSAVPEPFTLLGVGHPLLRWERCALTKSPRQYNVKMWAVVFVSCPAYVCG